MALGIRLEISTEGPADPEFAWWDEFSKNPPSPDEITYIRMPGVSQSGPCAICAQFFGMEHDGSGKEVPLIPLHPSCCCIDSLVIINNKTDSPVKPMAKGEWLESGPGKDMQSRILGKGKAQLVKAGLATVDELYRRRGPLSRPVDLAKAAGSALSAASKAELVKAARRAGVALEKRMTRKEIMNAILARGTGRDVL